MCTVVFLYRPDHHWPLLLAGNRDEMRDRPSLPPAQHWPSRPGVVAGLDQLAGGSWLGMNSKGVVSVVMNREGTLGPLDGKRSRGELVLRALGFGSASHAAKDMASIYSRDYRAFNLLICDSLGCYWIKNSGENISPQVEVISIVPGLHMLTAHELDDINSHRTKVWLKQFQNAATPNPGSNDWHAWHTLMSRRDAPDEFGPHAAMNVDLAGGFGTVSSTLIALPASGSAQEVVWLFADDAPDKTSYSLISI